MKLTYSPRGTGACPLCKKAGHCVLQNNFQKRLEKIEAEKRETMEMVIYICPYFTEIV